MARSPFSRLSIGNYILSFSLSAAVYVLLANRISLWGESGIQMLPSAKFSLPILLAIALGGFLKARADGDSFRIEPVGVLLTLAIVFISDWLTRPYNLLQGPSIRGEILLFSIACYYLFKHSRGWVLGFTVALSSILLATTLWQAADGRVLFSDDHAVFLYRLELLKRNFPNIPFFEPRWNAGSDARDFFATGALNVFFTMSPLLYSFSINDIYNLCVLLILFILPPCVCFYAGHLAGFSKIAAAISGTLMISGNLLWYRWGLQYGTLGFMTSLMLLPLNLVLVCKILSKTEELTKGQAIVFAVSFTLMLLWSPAGLIFFPSVIWGVCKIRSVFRKKYVPAIILFLLVANIPWILIFWSVSNVSKFVVEGGASYNRGYDLQQSAPVNDPQIQKSSFKRLGINKTLTLLRENTVSWNPLLFLLSIPGFFLIKRFFSQYLSVHVLWLILIGAGLAPANPRLELDRLLVTLANMLALPTGACLAFLATPRFITKTAIVRLPLSALAHGFLIAGIFSSTAVLLNRTLIQYSFADPTVADICRAFSQHSNGGRVLFSGFVLHELSDGHLAPLVNNCEVPLVASSQYHNIWRYTQVFPKGFLKRGDQGIEEYLNLYNVTLVTAHEPYWRKYFAEKPELYKFIEDVGEFKIFQRLGYESNYFLSGQGKDLVETSNSVGFYPLTSDIILKYRYFPFLRSSQCEISPFPIDGEINFIALKNCIVGEPVKINSSSAWQRVKSAL